MITQVGLFFILLLGVICDLDVNVWVQHGYHYGYNCELTFQFIADNFSTIGENIHLSTDGTIGFEQQDYNSMLVLAADGKQYQFYSYQCLVQNRNQTRTCFQIFGQVDNVIPAWAQILHTFNSTHKYFLTRIKTAYCPVNHTIKPSLNIVVPQSYSGSILGAVQSGVKYNKTIQVLISNLSYRDLGWVSPRQSTYQLGCPSTFVFQWTFISPEFGHSWYQATLTFENISKINIDVTNCAPLCQIVNNNLIFTNGNHSSIQKNMSGWDNNQYNTYSLLENRNNSDVQTLAFTFDFPQQINITYDFSVSSKFMYNQILPQQFEHQNLTYHGVTTHSMRLLTTKNYHNAMGTYLCSAGIQQDIPDINTDNSTSFIQSLKNFMSQFSVIILGVYCLLILIVRRIPFLVEKLVYILLCVVQLPLTITCLIIQDDDVRYKILIIFVIVEQIFSKLCFIHYSIIFCRSEGLSTKITTLDRFKIQLNNFYNFRLIYLIYSKLPCCSTITNIKHQKKSILITHAIHLILGAGIKLFLIIVSINTYLINIDSFKVQTMFIIIQILLFILSMLIIKYSLMTWKNIRAREALKDSNRSPPASKTNSDNNQQQDNNDFPMTQDELIRDYQRQDVQGISQIRGLSAYEDVAYQITGSIRNNMGYQNQISRQIPSISLPSVIPPPSFLPPPLLLPPTLPLNLPPPPPLPPV